MLAKKQRYLTDGSGHGPHRKRQTRSSDFWTREGKDQDKGGGSVKSTMKFLVERRAKKKERAGGENKALIVGADDRMGQRLKR